MSDRRLAPSGTAQDTADDPSALWHWPPSADDLAAIACVDLTHAVADVRVPGAAHDRRPTYAPRGTGAVPPLAARGDLVWPPSADDLSGVTAIRLDGADPLALARRRGIASRRPPRVRVPRPAVAAAAACVLATGVVAWRLEPERAPRSVVSEVTQTGRTFDHDAANVSRQPAEQPLPARRQIDGRAASPPVTLPTGPRSAAAPQDAPATRVPYASSLVETRRAPVEQLASASALSTTPATRVDVVRGVPASQQPAPMGLGASAALDREVAGAVPITLPVPAAVRADADAGAQPSTQLAEPGPTAGVRPSGDRTRAASTTPPAVAASAAAPVSEDPSIRAVLQEYGAAYRRLDARAARAVWPSVDARALARAFDALESQQLTFDRCDVTVTGSNAQAACHGSSTYVPRVGDRTPRTEARQWTFRLQKADGARWQISSASIR